MANLVKYLLSIIVVFVACFFVLTITSFRALNEIDVQKKDFVELHKNYVDCFYYAYSLENFEGFRNHFEVSKATAEVYKEGYKYKCNEIVDWDKFWELRKQYEAK